MRCRSKLEAVQKNAGKNLYTPGVEDCTATKRPSRCTDLTFEESVQGRPSVQNASVQQFRANLKRVFESGHAWIVGDAFRAKGIVVPLRQFARWRCTVTDDDKEKMRKLFEVALKKLGK